MWGLTGHVVPVYVYPTGTFLQNFIIYNKEQLQHAQKSIAGNKNSFVQIIKLKVYENKFNKTNFFPKWFWMFSNNNSYYLLSTYKQTLEILQVQFPDYLIKWICNRRKSPEKSFWFPSAYKISCLHYTAECKCAISFSKYAQTLFLNALLLKKERKKVLTIIWAFNGLSFLQQ